MTDFLAAVESAGGDVAQAASERASLLRAQHASAENSPLAPKPEAIVELAGQLHKLVDAFKDARLALANARTELEGLDKDAAESLERLLIRNDQFAGHFDIAPPPELLLPNNPDSTGNLDNSTSSISAVADVNMFFEESHLSLSRRIALSNTLVEAVDALFDHVIHTVQVFSEKFTSESPSRAVMWCTSRVKDFCVNDFVTLALPEAPGCQGNELTKAEWEALASALSQALVAADKGADVGLGISFILFRELRPILQKLIKEDNGRYSGVLTLVAHAYGKEL